MSDVVVTINVDLKSGRIDRSQDPPIAVEVGSRLVWQCDNAEFAVVDIKKQCPSSCAPHPDNPFEEPLKNRFTDRGTQLGSTRAKKEARGCRYKTTWVTRTPDGIVDAWDPHFIVWP